MYQLELTGRQKHTYDSLRNAYKELLLEKPHHEITATEIAKRAKLSRNTFYQYFRDKDEVFLSVHRAHIELIGGKLFTKEELLAAEPPSHMVQKYQLILLSKRTRRMLISDPLSNIFVKGAQNEIAFNLRLSILEKRRIIIK